jgi:hypothetical protein
VCKLQSIRAVLELYWHNLPPTKKPKIATSECNGGGRKYPKRERERRVTLKKFANFLKLYDSRTSHQNKVSPNDEEKTTSSTLLALKGKKGNEKSNQFLLTLIVELISKTC